MNLKKRVTKLEQIFLVESIEEIEEAEMCEHPPSMFVLYRCYPAKGHSDRSLVVKGHCNNCGFDDYLWSFYALTEDQEAKRQELKYSSDFWGLNAYDLELINAGLMSYALFPPSPEVQMKFTGRVSI